MKIIEMPPERKELKHGDLTFGKVYRSTHPGPQPLYLASRDGGQDPDTATVYLVRLLDGVRFAASTFVGPFVEIDAEVVLK